MNRLEVWGPATPMLLALEANQVAVRECMRRAMATMIYGPVPVYPYTTPQSVLRRRATYGGRKGRRAIQRLRAMGARPLTTLWPKRIVDREQLLAEYPKREE